MAKPCLLRLHFATFCGHCKRFAVAKLYIFWGSTKPAAAFPTRFTLILFYHPRCTCKSVDSRHPTTLLSVGKQFAGIHFLCLSVGEQFAAIHFLYLSIGELFAGIHFLCLSIGEHLAGIHFLCLSVGEHLSGNLWGICPIWIAWDGSSSIKNCKNQGRTPAPTPLFITFARNKTHLTFKI